MVNLKKGQNPTFPDQGIDPKLASGRSQITVAYPILFRQLVDTVSTDDTFKSISLKDIRTESDAVYIDVELRTRAGDFDITQTLTLS